MKLRKLIAVKIESFYKEVDYKRRKGRKTRLQIDLEFKRKNYLI